LTPSPANTNAMNASVAPVTAKNGRIGTLSPNASIPTYAAISTASPASSPNVIGAAPPEVPDT
jgi:hypothetical protein